MFGVPSPPLTVEPQTFATLLVLAARRALERPGWAWLAVCKAIVDYGAALPRVERQLLLELLADAEPTSAANSADVQLWRSAVALLARTDSPRDAKVRWARPPRHRPARRATPGR